MRDRLYGTVYGTTDEAVLETVTFFCSLPHSNVAESVLCMSYNLIDTAINLQSVVDFAALREDQLIRILQSNPKRQLELEIGSWSLEQARILATQSFPLNLKFTKIREGWTGIGPKDDGSEFINHLEIRRTCFGSLTVGDPYSQGTPLPISREMLERILNLEGKIDTLTIGLLNPGQVLLPFSAKVNALTYKVKANHLQPSHFDTLDIATKRLDLIVRADNLRDLMDVYISFCDRVSELGHFERLAFNPKALRGSDAITVSHLAQAFSKAIRGNSNLTCLYIGVIELLPSSDSQLIDLFKALGEAEKLRTVSLHRFPLVEYYSDVEDYHRLCQPFYSLLERLLSRNRKITVLDIDGERITNGTTIDKIYALNFFYNGAAKLLKESTARRSSLVVTALTESAAANFQYSAQLLSFHTDLLWEFLEDAFLSDDDNVDAARPVLEQSDSNH
ncbi:hypothetical protein FisN_10Hu384 [Fistulifera solaris]|uniref:Uncharacterized protein n=1 Tax=Fistulifera solaris TaxID=1519565 RepID=A0A1Z5JQV0_FISSO|nr:hypothetical protein FisN_10Hu384 [Fistulifera solaris]|eukprot:GAX16387.1 hypothetical protein FisN_10Hu384 [Fistulifera solaris]